MPLLARVKPMKVRVSIVDLLNVQCKGQYYVPYKNTTVSGDSKGSEHQLQAQAPWQERQQAWHIKRGTCHNL
jgi:hypothetical protein